MRFEHRAPLAASPERVWAVLADWERYAEWMADVAWVRRVGDEQGVGMRVAVRTKVFGIPVVTDELVVTAWDPPRRMAIEHVGLVRGPAEWLLQPRGEHTEFTWIEELEMPPPILGGLALFLYSPVLRWTFGRTVRNLARMISSA